MKAITLNCHHCVRSRSAVSIIPPAMRFITSSFPFSPSSLRNIPQVPLVAFAKKKNSGSEPVLSPSITEEVFMDDDLEEDILLDDELLDDDGYFDDEYFEEEAEPSVGDGAGGGGISLAGTEWDKKAFKIAEEVCLSFDGELGIYAFRTQLNATIKVRIERLTNKSGSPNMTDIDAFTTAYRMRLDEAEATGDIPQNISLEVSSPGVERVVQVPQDLERFKDRNLYVKYIAEVTDSGLSPEVDGVFRLISYNTETRCCTWGLADVRVNREKSGKGRPLSKKQKEWRLNTPLDSLRLVRLFSDM
ncbi:hypothetical protein SASPL_104136 [Salvia splendens]|uniref:DUF7912 domain-containing protein n=1 Tax=Salvia splendens TaxID=180675 RepID=A0A8X8YM84_SALSN|nr:uncharacterized protein LOC121761216 [Salvia splendens]KAG6432556.1 hypothetical protein SASPL_104136 [Salvia splendens]